LIKVTLFFGKLLFTSLLCDNGHKIATENTPHNLQNTLKNSHHHQPVSISSVPFLSNTMPSKSADADEQMVRISHRPAMPKNVPMVPNVWAERARKVTLGVPDDGTLNDAMHPACHTPSRSAKNQMETNGSPHGDLQEKGLISSPVWKN